VQQVCAEISKTVWSRFLGFPFCSPLTSCFFPKGAWLTIVGMIFLALIFCMPQSFMSAELSLLCKENGGSILWVDRAFGDAGGFINAFTVLFAAHCSCAMSLTLFSDYLGAVGVLNVAWISWLSRLAVVALSIVINFVGPHLIAGLSAILTLTMFLPFIIMAIVLGVQGKYSVAHWTRSMSYVPHFDEVDWPTYISTIIWCIGGFDYVGALCGEVKGGSKIFFRGLLLSLPFSIATYALPIMLCVVVITPSTPGGWVAGAYTEIAQHVTPWLGYVMIAASCVGMFGQVVAGISFVSRQVWSTAFTITPRWVGYTHSNGSPIVGIFISSLIVLGLSGVPFGTLGQVFLMQRVVALLFAYASVIRLRFLEPETHRPFAIAGGVAGCIAIAVPTVGVSFFMLYYTRDPLIWIISGTVEGAIIAAYIIRLVYFKCRKTPVVVFRRRHHVLKAANASSTTQAKQ
jgi:amino acid transporter